MVDLTSRTTKWIKNQAHKPQYCKAADILRFLFSFCNTNDGADEVVSNDRELKLAFEKVRELANEPNSPLRERFNHATAAKNEATMYSPLVKALNFALDRLSKLKVAGLPDFQDRYQVAFARIFARCAEHEDEDLRSPDIVLVKWNASKVAGGYSGATYSESHESNLCCDPSFIHSPPEWVDFLSTLEVGCFPPASTLGSPGDETREERGPVEYIVDFGGLQGDPEVSPLSSCPGMVDLERPMSTPSRDLGDSDSDDDLPAHLEEPLRLWERVPKALSAAYGIHKLSCSFDISHTISLILVGTSFYLTWTDRQGIIESGAIDVVDDLPHFLLLLLILQRFNDAKWGCFTECPQSGVKIEQGQSPLTLSFVGDGETGQRSEVVFHPTEYQIHIDKELVGCGASVIGGRRGPPPDPTQLSNMDKIYDGNDIDVKIYWAEESRISEVEILKKAEEYGRKTDFIGNHIPEIVCHRDPEFLCSSTKMIRRFLGLPTGGCRRLRVFAFGALELITELKEKDMLTAYLQCLFCHFYLWKMGIRHGNVCPESIKWDARRKVGVLNDFYFATFGDHTSVNGQPEEKRKMLPFMALDLIPERYLHEEVPVYYRHEAESFAWSLIYLSLAMVEGEDGKGYIRLTSDLQKWSDCDISFSAKSGLEWSRHDHPGVSHAYPNAKKLSWHLHRHFKCAFCLRVLASCEARTPRSATMEGDIPYEEPRDDLVFEKLLECHESGLRLQEIKEMLAAMTLKYTQINLDS